MSCVDVRGLLAEHALGVLGRHQFDEVERHVRSCPGCRKELGELQEGAALIGFALPSAEPPAALEGRVVDRVGEAAGRRTPWHPSRRRVRLLAVAMLAAVLSAGGAFGWAIAEKRRADDVALSERQKVQQLEALQQVIEGLPGGEGGPGGGAGASFQAELSPMGTGLGFGRAVIFSAPRDDDWVVIDVVPPPPEADRYTVQVLDDDGQVLSAGDLKKTATGDWFFLEFSGQDLGAAASVSVQDGTGRAVLFGVVTPYSAP